MRLTLYYFLDQAQMIVSEGLTCSFRQEAVAIDLNKSEFTPVGKVQKTVVVTPDLS